MNSDNTVSFIFPHKFQYKYSESLFKKISIHAIKMLDWTHNIFTLAIIFDELSHKYEEPVSYFNLI